MIISASYKSDIPAFYGKWMINRIRAGFCMMKNPYSIQVYKIDLTKKAVDGFVFWTKNIGPFLQHLKEIDERGYPFIVQYTINGYPRILESSVVDASRSVEHMKCLSDTYGPKVAVWRYDTVVFSSVTSLDFHRRNFETLAKSLQGTTDEVIISFAQFYRKTLRNMNIAAQTQGFTWEDPSDETKNMLASELAQIAKSFGMQLSMCSQRQYLTPGVSDAKCIDAQRISQVSGRQINAKQKGNRPDCGCFISKDIGEYDTCPHGCVYCYAVQNRERAIHRHKAHDPEGEFLYTPEKREPSDIDATNIQNDLQETLF